MIKFIYDDEASIPADIKSHYTKREDGKWLLQVEGAVGREKLDEFRTTNTNLIKEKADLVKKFEAVDPDDYRRLKGIETELQEKKLKGTDSEKILEQRTAEMKKAHAAEVDKLKADLQTRDGELGKLRITDAAIQAATKKGLKPGAVEDLAFRAQSAFKLQDGKVVAMMPDGTTQRFNAQGEPFGIDDMVVELTTKAPHLFEASGGGNAGGNNGGKTGAGGTTVNPWKQEHWNMTAQGQILKADRPRAERLAAEAGRPLAKRA